MTGGDPGRVGMGSWDMVCKAVQVMADAACRGPVQRVHTIR